MKKEIEEEKGQRDQEQWDDTDEKHFDRFPFDRTEGGARDVIGDSRAMVFIVVTAAAVARVRHVD